MANVLVVYCSMSGNTKSAAEAIAMGARSAGATVVLKSATEAEPEDLVQCDAVALGSYDAFSYIGGGLKDYFDRSFYPTQGQVTDKPYAAFITHGGGGKAVQSIESLAQSFKLRRIGPTLSIKGTPAGQALTELRELGAKLAQTGTK